MVVEGCAENRRDTPCDNIHRENNGAEHSQFAQNISSLFLSLVHADVDLSKVIGMGS